MSQFNHQRHSFIALSCNFVVDSAYQFVKPLGQGAYGTVVASKHAITGDGYAIKKITHINTKAVLMKRCLREIKLLRHFRGHKNITCLYDLDIVFDPSGDFDDVYLYEELMETDLHTIIKFGEALSEAHVQYIIYQTLCALKYIHSSSVLHRDIKPGNLLVDTDTTIKICDFGLARGHDQDALPQEGRQILMTEYVATRWYRAPEIMLSFANYTTAIDIWSTGCVLAELLGRRALFQGRDYVDQLNQILNILGTPNDRMLARICSPRAQEYIRSLPFKPGVPFSNIYPRASPLALDLLTKMLAFDPSQRISCEDALRHPFLAPWRDPTEEITSQLKFNFDFEKEESMEGMKKLIVEEVASFRQQVRSHSRARQARRQDSLPIQSRDDILATSPSLEGSFPSSPTEMSMLEPSAELEAELQRGGV